MYRFEVVTLFPALVQALAVEGITARALTAGIASLRCWNPRDFTRDRHRRVDDRPYGGGPGMVMMAGPLCAATGAARAALADAGHDRAHTVYLTPQGRRFDQARARALAAREAVVLVCGRYEGVDERFVDAEVDEELSLGDFVLSGGELAAMAVVETVTRLLPGALGHEDSAVEDSFSGALLDCPHYTRPEEFEGRRVPPVLLSGDHEAVRRWRLEQALARTLERRPDLLEQAALDEEQTELLGTLRGRRAPSQGRRKTASAPAERGATGAGANDERRDQSDRSGADGPRAAGVRPRRHGGGEGEGA